MSRTRWLHYSENISKFYELGVVCVDSDDPAAFTDGLCVYKYYGPEQDAEGQRMWFRTSVLLECDGSLVESLQENPLDDNPWWDEYFIPAEHFTKVRVLSLRETTVKPLLI